MFHTIKGARQFLRISQTANSRSNNIYQFFQFVIVFYFISFFNISDTFVESSFHGKRTKFYEAVNYIKRQSKLTALVVDTVDRLQRTFNEFPMLLELVKKEKLALHFFKEGLVIDKNFKSSDLAMWQMQILSANMFVNSTRDNVKRSEERMLNEGLAWLRKFRT